MPNIIEFEYKVKNFHEIKLSEELDDYALNMLCNEIDKAESVEEVYDLINEAGYSVVEKEERPGSIEIKTF